MSCEQSILPFFSKDSRPSTSTQHLHELFQHFCYFSSFTISSSTPTVYFIIVCADWPIATCHSQSKRANDLRCGNVSACRCHIVAADLLQEARNDKGEAEMCETKIKAEDKNAARHRSQKP